MGGTTVDLRRKLIFEFVASPLPMRHLCNFFPLAISDVEHVDCDVANDVDDVDVVRNAVRC